MIDRRGDGNSPSAKTDWPAFVATLDPELLRRFDDVIYGLPPVVTPDAVIEQVDSLISGTGIAYGRNGYSEWNAYVTDVRELAMLRERLRHWFFERGYRDDARLAAHLGTLMLDPRTRLASVPTNERASTSLRQPAAISPIVVAAPYVFALVVLLAILCAAMMMTFQDVVGRRNATAGLMLAMGVTMLSIGAIIGTVRKRHDRAPLPTTVTVTPPAPVIARGILVTRDSVCMADDIEAPHAGRIEIDPDADVLSVADAILAAGYLPAVAGGSTWSVRLGDAPDADAAVFGHRLGGSFSHRVDGGTATLRSTGMARLDIRYHRQERPADVIGGLAMARRSATEGPA